MDSIDVLCGTSVTLEKHLPQRYSSAFRHIIWEEIVASSSEKSLTTVLLSVSNNSREHDEEGETPLDVVVVLKGLTKRTQQ